MATIKAQMKLNITEEQLSEAVERALKNNPDFVLVVRCKDCKHYKPQRISVHWEHKTPYCMRGTAVKVSEDDFCSYGERRADNGC